jgi:hypothetical protein
METAASGELTKVLSSFLPRTAVNEMVAGWAGRDGERVRQVEELLDQSGFTMEHVMAETLVERIEDIERIDRMIVSAEQRRSAMLREVDRHRASLASRLRLASDEVVQAEFEDVTPTSLRPAGTLSRSSVAWVTERVRQEALLTDGRKSGGSALDSSIARPVGDHLPRPARRAFRRTRVAMACVCRCFALQTHRSKSRIWYTRFAGLDRARKPAKKGSNGLTLTLIANSPA